MNKKLFTYKKSGVNISSADKFVNFISKISSKKKGNKKFNNIGGFGSRKNINKDFSPLIFKEENEFTDDVSIRIEEVLNEKIRPAVAMDGGDIRLKSFKNGVAEVMLKGACAGCPSSTITLKHGVERMIKHYVPEVTSVEAININE